MATISERLRAAAPGTLLSGHVSDLAALREAADEIDRLKIERYALLREQTDDSVELQRVYDLLGIPGTCSPLDAIMALKVAGGCG